eukprot:TRINITY_DN1848_c0_g1_i1.p1 TRINITY_DN1848_c0_g1~~TRINITY_DN1848_c0_g1_i1.p1  ORF type:complete len:506 (-),score=129.25 TRINITY_DN1848_c0_g1_i1:203-1720(-)
MNPLGPPFRNPDGSTNYMGPNPNGYPKESMTPTINPNSLTATYNPTYNKCLPKILSDMDCENKIKQVLKVIESILLENPLESNLELMYKPEAHSASSTNPTPTHTPTFTPKKKSKHEDEHSIHTNNTNTNTHTNTPPTLHTPVPTINKQPIVPKIIKNPPIQINVKVEPSLSAVSPDRSPNPNTKGHNPHSSVTSPPTSITPSNNMLPPSSLSISTPTLKSSPQTRSHTPPPTTPSPTSNQNLDGRSGRSLSFDPYTMILGPTTQQQHQQQPHPALHPNPQISPQLSSTSMPPFDQQAAYEASLMNRNMMNMGYVVGVPNPMNLGYMRSMSFDPYYQQAMMQQQVLLQYQQMMLMGLNTPPPSGHSAGAAPIPAQSNPQQNPNAPIIMVPSQPYVVMSPQFTPQSSSTTPTTTNSSFSSSTSTTSTSSPNQNQNRTTVPSDNTRHSQENKSNQPAASPSIKSTESPHTRPVSNNTQHPNPQSFTQMLSEEEAWLDGLLNLEGVSQ